MSLYKVASVTKKVAVVVIGILVLLLAAKIVISITDKLSNSLVTRKSEETRGFGPLHSPVFVEIDGADKHNPNFSVETLEGTLPEYDNLFNVYRIKTHEIDLSSEPFAYSIAEYFGFDGEPEKLSTVDYQWNEGVKKLEFNIQNRNFYYTNTSVKAQKSDGQLGIDDPSGNAEKGVNVEDFIISAANSLEYQLPENNEVSVEPLIKVNNKLVRADPRDAEWFRASIHQVLPSSGEETAKTYSAYYLPTTMNVLVPAVENYEVDDVASMRFYYWEPDLDNVQTYYGLTTDQAYQKLQNGEYALVRAFYAQKSGVPDVKGLGQVRITDVEVGYYTTSSKIVFIQPIYIFYGSYGEGEDRIDLVYYVSALS